MSVPVLAMALLLTAQDDGPPPEHHPGLVLPTVDGGSGALADHLGRKTVVFHFASW
jgi:hypothetical protein